MQVVCLGFVSANLKVSQRDRVADQRRRRGAKICPCRPRFLGFRKRQQLIDYGTTGHLLLLVSMQEETSESQSIPNKATSASEEKKDSQSISSRGSADVGKKGSSKKKSTTKRRRMRKKQEQLPDTEVVTVPISRKPNPPSGADYWMDPKDVVVAQDKKQVPSPPTDLSSDMKGKLKTEIVSPYRQNWILFLIGAVVLLTLAYRFLPADQIFDHIPDL
ncbi:hypothetical protein GpartN1_g303.t1 [Galdieria partita]|uniref:Uncharacterized protein n=1 Tax=Galdieria partita TaxID=83374 RepID=A0A9C7UME4_9RHOD|nr:hypothetical protein GpartN1_g303.t1 [Galdieria partita]